MKFEKGKIFNANELVDYADGGIVSKELIHNAFRCIYSSNGWRDNTQCGGYRPLH